MVWGSLIGAGASIIGGALASGASGSANDANMEIMRQQLAFQREMAQNGVRWKVEDAKAAGIHPIYALGAPPFNASPVAIANQPDTSWANALTEAGQHIGNAVDRTKTQGERLSDFQETQQLLTLDNMRLQNAALQTDIDFKRAEYGAIIGRSQFGPPFPDPHAFPDNRAMFVNSGPPSNISQPRFGSSTPALEASGLVQSKPHEPVSRDPSKPYQEPGDITDRGWSQTSPNRWTAVPSKDVKERIEDSVIPELQWIWRNHIADLVYPEKRRPPFPAPAGKHWEYRPWTQEYELMDNGKTNWRKLR